MDRRKSKQKSLSFDKELSSDIFLIFKSKESLSRNFKTRSLSLKNLKEKEYYEESQKILLAQKIIILQRKYIKARKEKQENLKLMGLDYEPLEEEKQEEENKSKIADYEDSKKIIIS